MAYFREIPYTTLSQLNLNWLIKGLQTLETEIGNFVALNTIKYANPFDWDITTQYAMNTLVFNTADYTAYLSVKPVPSGVQIDNTDYWTPVFTLKDVLTAYRDAITPVFEQAGSPATTTIEKGQLFWIESDVYYATAKINQGDTVAIGTNCAATNISSEILKLVGLIDDEQNAITAEQTAREQADQQLHNAIAAEQTAREQKDQQLQSAITAEQTAREQADQQLKDIIDESTDTLYVDVTNYGADKTGATDSFPAIQAAMNDAKSKNISIIYFPNGTYLCNSQIILDTSKFRFLGGSATTITTNITNSDFIVLESPLSLQMYDFARVPLKNLCIEGNTFTDTASASIAAISFGLSDKSDETLVSPHIALENVVVRRWSIGYALRTAYKTDFINCSAIACNFGIYIPSSGLAQAVPTTFVGCYFECCNIAIYALAGGYNCLYFYGGAFEYNRSVYSGFINCIFDSVRFEMDVLSSCSNPTTYRYVFNASGSRTQYIKFNSCQFLAIHNFSGNVGYWISDPYTLDSMNQSVFFGYINSQTGKAVYYFDKCELSFADGQYPTSVYLVSANNVYAMANNVIGSATQIFNPGQLVTSNNGLL